jgi:hypothetical protein
MLSPFLLPLMNESWDLLAPSPAAVECFAMHQLAVEFRRELEQRQAFRDYCDWYATVAAQHRQELEQMQSDWNLFGWFCRRR